MQILTCEGFGGGKFTDVHVDVVIDMEREY